jgi:alpha-amylase
VSILMPLPGTPYIYYGEEIGMKGLKPDEFIREPFLWDEDKKDKMQTSWEAAKYSTDKEVIPFSKQKDDPNSIYQFYKKWITYRNSSDALTNGTVERSGMSSTEMVSYLRQKGDEKLLVLHNISDVEVTIPLTEKYKIDFSTQEGIAISNNEIKIPAHSTVILAN